MSLKKGNQDQNQNTAMRDALERAQGQGQTNNGGTPPNFEAQQQRRGRRSIVEMNSAMPRPVSRQPTGEVVMKFQESLGQQMRRNIHRGFEDAFQLLVLDNNTQNVPLSALLMCYHERGNGVDYLAVYSLLVEGSAGRLNDRTINMGAQSVTIETVAGDVFVTNDYMWSKIVEHVNNTYGKDMVVENAGSMVLPTELDPEDEAHIRRIVYNGTQACFTVMDSVVGGGEDPFAVSWVNSSSDTLQARLEFNPGQAENAAGLPLRSDVRVSLQGSLAGQKNEAGFEQVRGLATVDGFVDLVYSPPQGPVTVGQPMPTQHYYPRFVITRADTEVDAITLELQLLALGTTTLLRSNMNWAGVYRERPKSGKDEVDLRDVGAIGYDVNLTGDPHAKPEYIDTKAASFDTNALFQFISAAIRPDLMVSMDVEEVGELSWIHQTFLAAANGNQEASQMIFDAANNLTLDNFGKVYEGGPICVDDHNRIHLGYYIDSKGQKRDLRDIDYLALLNIAGKDDPNVVVEWGNTFDQVDIPLEVRLERRTKILKALIEGTVHVKGYARRITFNPKFLEALALGCVNAGLVIRPYNTIQEFTGTPVRGNFNAGNFALSGAGSQALFTSGGQQWGGQGSMFGNYSGRFGRF